ncbi:MAG: hypothetical protein R8G66_01155 [Cytophagales bacterium]|nr:hypothetical protein [Cytophagales bacterium]
MNSNIYSKLYSIFFEKGWSKNHYSRDAFDALSNLVANINEEQQDLILELLDRYHWIKFNESEPGVYQMLEFIDKISSSFKRLYIGPIIKISDDGKIKSGHGATYIIKSLSPRTTRLKTSNTKFIDSYDGLKLKDNERLLVVDDYIGSGKTALIALNELNSIFKIPTSKITLVVFGAQESALDELQARGIDFYVYQKYKKGISDFYTDTSLTNKSELMKKVENLIPKLNRDYSFGMNQTEALVTFNERTPNNTFPIFWMKHKYKNKEFEPAFPR